MKVYCGCKKCGGTADKCFGDMYPGADFEPIKCQEKSEAVVRLNNLLSAIKGINGICEETAELSNVHTHEEAMSCDQALTDILHLCEETLKQYHLGT